jgi:choice-of-anchor A domain-containing protein
MYRLGLTCLLSAAVILGALRCSPSEPGPAPAEAKPRAAAQGLTAPSCANCLDIHLSDYNLFLLEDYSGGLHVAGKVAAGGNITLDSFGVGSALPDDNVSNTLVAGGNLHLTNGTVSGATWYGGSYTPTPDWSVTFHRGTAAQGTPIDFAARFAELRSLSSRLATQHTPNGTTESQWGNLYMTGQDPCLNVFEVNASDFQNAQGRNIQAPAGSFVVVNIRGTTLTFSGGISFSGGITPQRVLYNFVDATRIDASDFGLPGTVLAPHARLTFNDGGWSGGIYAVSLRGDATGLLSPLEDMAGAQAEVCNEVDDDCNGQVDDGFECSGSGSRTCTAWCGAEGTQSCSPDTCGYGECTSASCCRADADCASGFFCEGSLCTAQRQNGQACGSSNQCANGQCVDGVCCNTACAGACDACNLPGHEGTCSPAPSTVQCRGAAGTCDVAEYCTGTGANCPADSKKPAGTTCNDGNAGTTGDRCEGAGVCTGCGDGVRNGPEACDDGNTVTETSCPNGQASCTVCNASCTQLLTLQTAYCGDGVRNGSETCDYGTNSPCPYGRSCLQCNTSCTGFQYVQGGYCGDGAANGPEACDYGSNSCPYGQSCYQCNTSCTGFEYGQGGYCGDGVTNGPETCDYGNNAGCAYGQSCYQCSTSCNGFQPGHGGYCGDGVTNGPEACDYGNNSQCNSTCTGTTTPAPVVCRSPSNGTESLFMGWYEGYLHRCADEGGLAWWVSQYRYGDTCAAGNRDYSGYIWSSKDECFLAEFLHGAELAGEYP